MSSAGHHVTFDHDVASRPHRFKELYNDAQFPHKLIATITLKGSHATLTHTETLRHLIDRIYNFGVEYAKASGDLSLINWCNVHLRDDDSIRQMV
jgi:hypothetical protein